MRSIRRCSRSVCSEAAVATLTYVYADSTAVLGPLALYAEPHCYDLCSAHADRLTVPRGWEVVRLAMPDQPQPPHPDDLLALADAVREAAAEPEPADRVETGRRNRFPAARGHLEPPPGTEGIRRGHLRVLRDQP